MKTISQQYEIEPVNVHDYAIDDKVSVADKELVYGIELEIEGVPNARERCTVLGIRYTTDGSLRNNGVEFITMPMRLNQMAYLLHKFLDGNFDESNYSERTSIHVHANVLDLNVDQLSCICLLYQTFEPLLFEFIGHGREKNIFCVPWYDSTLTYEYVGKMMEEKNVGHVHRWMKYSALNLLPIRTQGTIEFRHMAGHSDSNVIIDWCNLIGCIFSVARNRSLKDVKEQITTLNTTSHYDAFLHYVFRQWAVLLQKEHMRLAMEEGVTMVKYMLMKNHPRERKLVPPVFNQELMDNLVRRDEYNRMMNDVREENIPIQALPNVILEQERARILRELEQRRQEGAIVAAAQRVQRVRR